MLGKLHAPWIPLPDLKLVGPANPIAVDIMEINRKYPGSSPTRTRRPELGGMSIEEAYVYPTQESGTVPLYRYWNPTVGDHYYTTNFNELGYGAYGWTFEHVECYVFPYQASGTVPFHEYWNASVGDHFYTINLDELGPSGAYGWTYAQVQGYVNP